MQKANLIEVTVFLNKETVQRLTETSISLYNCSPLSGIENKTHKLPCLSIFIIIIVQRQIPLPTTLFFLAPPFLLREGKTTKYIMVLQHKCSTV